MARYVWPPRPILDPAVASKRMGDAMDAAWKELEAERVRVANSLTMGRKAAVDKTLREYQSAIGEFRETVDYNLERFTTLHLEPQYLEGVRQGGGQGAWTAVHTQAFAALATDTYSDFLQRSVAAEQTSQAFARALRRAAREELPKIAAGHTTAVQGGRLLRDKLINDYSISHVFYRDGTRVPIDVYSEMAARTKSAVAYNSGTLNEAYAQGATYLEVFDGSDCGWTSHGDWDKADGSIRHVEDAAAYPIAHPNCTRAFGPRPDIQSEADLAKALPSTTIEQRAASETLDWNPRKQAMRNRARQVSRGYRDAVRAARFTSRGLLDVAVLSGRSVARATFHDPFVTPNVKAATRSVGGRLDRLKFRVKDAASTERKILGDVADKKLGDAFNAMEASAKLSDTLRYTAVVSEKGYWASGDKIVGSLLDRGYTFDKGPLGWGRTGYRGRNIKMIDPSGLKFELQVHTEKSLIAAEKSHALLDIQRKTPRGAEWDRLEREMEALFQGVPIPKGTPMV